MDRSSGGYKYKKGPAIGKELFNLGLEIESNVRKMNSVVNFLTKNKGFLVTTADLPDQILDKADEFFKR